MTRSSRILIVVTGYAVALLTALAVTGAHVAATSGPAWQGSSGMLAFGDTALFVGVFGLTAVPATGAALFFLRPFRRFWHIASMVALAIATTAVVALLDYLVPRRTEAAFGTWSALAPLRILLAPLLSAAFILALLFAPTRAARPAPGFDGPSARREALGGRDLGVRLGGLRASPRSQALSETQERGIARMPKNAHGSEPLDKVLRVARDGQRRTWRDGLLLVLTAGLLTACGSEDRQAPTIADLVIEKAPDGSGDKQVGVAGKPLDQDFRARVTRDGKPVEGITVYWTTMQGSMNPVSDLTDADGISASRWTTKLDYVEQEAFASLEPVLGPRVPGSVLPGMIMFTALAYPDPDAPNTVLVLNDGGNRFEPANITVIAGGTVNWYWPVGSVGHSVVSDDGNAPATSGAPASYPKYLSFTFVIPGVYYYHCAVHGGSGGVGMSGSVTVLPPGSQSQVGVATQAALTDRVTAISGRH